MILNADYTHTFDMKDPDRSFKRMGWYHTICSCGTHLVAPTIRELTAKVVKHIEEA